MLRSLRNLPNKCSKTPDGFPAFFLKSIAPAIAFPLSCLFTMSMESSILPAVWKVGYVCPIFKKGARQLPSNCKRPRLIAGIHEVQTDKHTTIRYIYMLCAKHGFAQSRDCPAQTLDPWFVPQTMD